MKFNKLLLVFILIIVLVIKLKEIFYFIDRENIITGYDAFYYARLAEELINGEYTTVDYLRDVPDFSCRSSFPPFISYLAFLFSKILPLKDIYAFFPPILSVLFIIPLFLWLKKFSNIFVFISASLFGTLNVIYYSRTYIGKYDTDFLILFFVFLIGFLIISLLESIESKSLKKIVIYNLFIVFSFIIFMWHYGKPVFSIFFLLSTLLGYIAFFFNKKDTSKENFIYIFPVLVFFFSYFFISVNIGGILYKIKAYFLKEAVSSFLPANPEAYVLELQPVSIEGLINLTTGNPVIFILSILGFIIFIYKHFRYVIPFFPLIILGVFSLIGGNRFVMYLAPFIGAGFGYFVYLIFIWSKKYIKSKVLEYGFYISVLFFSINPNVFFIKIKPVLDEKVYYSLKEVKEKISDGYLWTWWDYGYFLEYMLKKGTYVDNGNRNLTKIYSIARSLVTTDEEETYRFISFITNKRRIFYKNLSFDEFLKAVRNYQKKPEKDIYIPLFEKSMFLSQFYMLGMLGSDIKSFELPAYKIFKKCDKDNDIFVCGKLFKLNKNLQLTFLNTKAKNISKIIIVSDERRVYKNWDKKGKLILQVRVKGKDAYFSFIDPIFYKSVINRMYFLKENFKHFELVYDNFPYLTLYKVK